VKPRQRRRDDLGGELIPMHDPADDHAHSPSRASKTTGPSPRLCLVLPACFGYLTDVIMHQTKCDHSHN
jgi:hypothetical protein